MRIEVVHERRTTRPVAEVFADLEAMGTEADRVWPSRRMPFVRTPGPMAVGVTRERHGVISAVLDGYEPERRIVWRATVPFLTGAHGFRIVPQDDGSALVAHDLVGETRWWFTPLWTLWMSRVHDRLVVALLDRVVAAAES